MSPRKTPRSSASEQAVNPGRHETQCTVCAHPKREEIENAFVNWTSPSRVAKQYSVSRDSIYRHAHGTGLMEKRRRNVRAALYRIIEKAGEVDVNAAAVVAAVGALARINSRGEWVERTQNVNLNSLFDRMNEKELEAYAKTGELPAWFDQNVGATPNDSSGGQNAR